MIPRTSLLAFGYGSLLMLGPVGNALAQDDGASPANAPTTVQPPAQTGQSGQASGQPALPADSTSSDSSANPSRAQVPDVNQSPVNPQPTNIPLFPAQLGNPISPYNSSSVNPQSPQLTQPTLYVTGVRDVGLISTNNALTQAFTAQETQGADIYGDESIMNYEHPPIERIKLGPFDLKAAAVTSIVADDNYRGGGGQTDANGQQQGKRSDISFALTPALNLVYGNHDGQKGFASLVYAPTLTRLYHDSENDTDDQNVALNVLYPFQRLTLNFTETYTETSGINTDTNQRTTQNSSLTTVGANYAVDDKLSVSTQAQIVDTTFQQQTGQGSQNGTSGGVGGTTANINTAVTYRLSEKLTLGPNINVGMDNPDGEQKSTYEQGLMAINYAPTEKIGAHAAAGAEFRQFDMGGGDKINPVFTLGVGYNPFDSMAFSLDASQTVHTSTAPIGEATNGDTVVTSSVGVSATQRIVQRVFVSFEFNYSHDEDTGQGGNGINGGGNGNNNDGSEDTLSYRPYVTFAPTQWSSVSLYYQYLTNVSNDPGQSYNDNQIGFSASVQF